MCRPWAGRDRSAPRGLGERIWRGLGALSVAVVPWSLLGGNEASMVPRGYEVRGKVVRYEEHSGKSFHYDFRVMVAGGRWCMEALPRDVAGSRLQLIRVVSDNRELYQVRYFGPEYSDAVVSPLPVPNFDPWLGTVWLTYCSAAFLRMQQTNWVPLPVTEYVFSGEPTAFLVAPGLEGRQEAWWELSGQPPGLPIRFSSVNPGWVQFPDQHGLWDTGHRFERPFDKGFTNVTFVAMEHANTGGLDLPRRARLEVWGLTRHAWFGGGGLPGTRFEGPLQRLLRMEVEAEAMSPFEGPIDIPPSFQGGGPVSDWRFQWSNRPMMVLYMSTNRLAAREEVLQMREYGQALAVWPKRLQLAQQMRLVPPTENGLMGPERGIWVRLILAGSAALGLLLLLYYRLGRSVAGTRQA